MMGWGGGGEGEEVHFRVECCRKLVGLLPSCTHRKPIPCSKVHHRQVGLPIFVVQAKASLFLKRLWWWGRRRVEEVV